MGPKAIGLLRSAMAARGRSFADEAWERAEAAASNKRIKLLRRGSSSLRERCAHSLCAGRSTEGRIDQ
jgi:hypothetical protein